MAFGQNTLIGTDLYVKNLRDRAAGRQAGAIPRLSPRSWNGRNTARPAALLATEPRLRDITLDWNEPACASCACWSIRIRPASFGITSEDISAPRWRPPSPGGRITQIRDGIFRSTSSPGDRGRPQHRRSIQNLQLARPPTGTPIPLAALAKLEYGTESSLIMQRDGIPTVTVMADIASGTSRRRW